MPVETLELCKKTRIGKVTVDHADAVIRIQSCLKIAAHRLDCLHMSRGDIARRANKREVFLHRYFKALQL